MLAFFKILISFAPWLSFLIIARDSLLRVEIGLSVALALTVLMGLLRLHRGIILWVGVAFFGGATIAVIGFNDSWTLRHLGILANGALALGAWLTIALGKPFTLDYAKEHVDPSLWNDPKFIRINVLMTAVWASAFTVSAVLAFGKMEQFALSELGYELISYAILISTAIFTAWYPEHLRRARAAL
ncbi:conserved hypothetical protein [Rhodopseudomonas palustris BisB5]|uniref:Intracellular septation protein A n=1 Tax=Rhodopseudomonas palustris (strain BisB5) TaxID=316057 RepID=Q137C9_RHOPS|nr:conserved hypothetical protein [Rhodopseudomonas palustris BisB5]